MKISGTHAIAAGRTRVWDALNDPEMLRRSLPGCESVVARQPGVFDVVLGAQVGPLKARFSGTLEMDDVQAPVSCVLHFRGQGGAMGFAQGRADVELREEDGATVVGYTAEAQIGGRLAQIGSRMVDAVARRTSEQFFAAFEQAIADRQPAEAAEAAAVAAAPGIRPAARAPAPPPPRPGPHLVPAWWLLLSTAIGAAAALAGVVLAR